MFCIQLAPQISAPTEPPMILSGEDRVSRRRARRRRNKRVFKQHAFPGNSIKRRRLHDRITVGTRMRPAPVVRDGKQDIGAIVAIGLLCDHRAGDQPTDQDRDGNQAERRHLALGCESCDRKDYINAAGRKGIGTAQCSWIRKNSDSTTTRFPKSSDIGYKKQRSIIVT